MQSLKRRRVLEAIAAGFGASLLASCGCGSDSGPSPNPPPPPPPPNPDCWVVYPNPCDPRILALAPGSGGRFILVGSKTDSGNIECAHQLMFFDAAETLSVLEFIPGENKLIGTSGGARISVCSASSATWGIGLLLGNDQLELNVTAIPGDIPVGQQSGSPRTGRRVQLTVQEKGCLACASQPQANAATAAMADITVAGCPGAHPQAFVCLRDQTGKLLDVQAANPAGDRQFTAFVTETDTPADALSDATGKAMALARSFETQEAALACLLSNLKGTSAGALCNGMIAALKSQDRFAAVYDQFAPYFGAPAGASEAQKVESISAFFTRMLNIAYLAVEFGERLEQAPGTNWSNAYSQYKSDSLALQGVLETGDGARFTGSANGPVSPGGPYPGLAIAAARAAAISRLALEPALPAVGQDYLASGILSCMEPGDAVTLSVAGTDGYSDSANFVVGAQGNVDFALGVPGTPAGVRDVLTVIVERAGGVVARRMVSLALG